MTDKQKIDEFFWNKTTPEVARDLLGMYLEHDTPEGRLAGYIVDAEAYLGPEDEAAHSYGLRRTPRVRAMYEKPGTIYAYSSDFEHHYSARRDSSRSNDTCNRTRRND